MPFDRSKFIETFKEETREHIQKLNLGLLRLEKAPQDRTLLEAMMREAHTIKGSATMMGYRRIAQIAHHMEDGLEKALKQELVLGKAHFDILFKCLDGVEPLLEDKLTWEDKGVERPFVDKLCAEAGEIFSGRVAQKAKDAKAAGKGRVTKTRKDAEAVVEKEAARPQLVEIARKTRDPGAREDSIRVDTERLDRLMNLSGELLISKIRLNDVVDHLVHKNASQGESGEVLQGLFEDLKSVKENIDFLTSNMQEEVMNIRMVPAAYLFNTFPRAMRDLARQKGKEIIFEMKGEDTRLDKTIIDEMKEPIMHLLRNAVDHGIEPAVLRAKYDKPEAGRIELSAYQQGSQIVLKIFDDGRGVDMEQLKQQAVKKGLAAEDKIETLTREQLFEFLFTPGFSTKQEVSEVSGRGVGLDVVRDTIVRLRGMVEVDSTFQKGTSFILRLPLTLAVTECLLTASGQDVFAVPIEAIVETVRIHPEEIKTVETKEVIRVRDHILPLVRFNNIFGLPKRGIFEKRLLPIVIVQSVEKRMGILFDEILGRKEIVSKPLGEPLKEIRDIAGATILGDGRVILILDIPSLINSAQGAVSRSFRAPVRSQAGLKKRKTILLAEDTMSTAMLEKNILESAGFSVVIAHDGKEALERAFQEKFDLVITDVLMPRVDGFELTSKLKKDKVYREVPVIIVTTRESEEDKRRGLEAGAEAYILKSEFTSDLLLDVIVRLIGQK